MGYYLYMKRYDVALAVLFLALESAIWLTGVTLDVVGGLIMR